MRLQLRPASRGRAPSAAVFVWTLLCLSPELSEAQPEPTGQLLIAAPRAVFGDRYQFESVSWRFTVRNVGAATVRITDRIALDGTGKIDVAPLVLEPQGAATITVTQPLLDRLGEIAFRYALRSDEPGAPRYRFSLSGFAQSAFDPERPGFDFGDVDRTLGGHATLDLGSREVQRLQVVEVEEAPSYLRVSWVDAGAGEDSTARIHATLLPGAPQGLLMGTFRLRTNVATQPRVAIRFRAQVFGDVVPDQNPLPLGAIRLGETGVGVVRFHSRSGSPFEIAPDLAEGPDSPLRLAVRSCGDAQAAPGCRELEVRFRPIFPGPISERIELRVAGDEAPLPILVTALAIRPDTVIQPLVAPPPLGREVPVSEGRP